MLLCLLLPMVAHGQAKKPSIMIVPSLTWCNEHGFVQQFDNQGVVETVADYNSAILNSGELKTVITQINNMMQDRGFPCKSLESSLATIRKEAAEDIAITSRSGADVAESPYDKLKKVAKSDIVIEVYWKENHQGPRRSVTFNLQALDAYTDKQIAGATGTGAPSMTGELAMLLQEAVQTHIDEFNNHLMTYFTDMAAKGREVTLQIRVWDDSPVDLESDVNGETLTDYIENWVSDNTVNNVYNLVDATDNMMKFEQVRIPLFDEQHGGRALDTRMWARELSKQLKALKIDNKLVMDGLGKAKIIIGGK